MYRIDDSISTDELITLPPDPGVNGPLISDTPSLCAVRELSARLLEEIRVAVPPTFRKPSLRQTA